MFIEEGIMHDINEKSDEGCESTQHEKETPLPGTSRNEGERTTPEDDQFTSLQCERECNSNNYWRLSPVEVARILNRMVIYINKFSDERIRLDFEDALQDVLTMLLNHPEKVPEDCRTENGKLHAFAFVCMRNRYRNILRHNKHSIELSDERIETDKRFIADDIHERATVAADINACFDLVMLSEKERFVFERRERDEMKFHAIAQEWNTINDEAGNNMNENSATKAYWRAAAKIVKARPKL